MVVKNKVQILFLFFCFAFHFGKAQSLKVAFTNGVLEYYAISDIQSISSNSDNVRLSLNSGTEYTWNASIIQNMTHVTLITEVADVNSLAQLSIYPNPSQGNVTIEIDLGTLTNLLSSLEIFDIRGNLIKQIPVQADNGSVRVSWKGTNAGGRPVPSGTYFCRIRTELGVVSKKMIILK